MVLIRDSIEARIDSSESIQYPAILGGGALRLRQWPKWPRAAATTQRNLLDVLHSTKWTLSGQSDRTDSYEQRFAKAFAEFCGTKYCVPCGSGTSALTIALQGIGVGPGDEVIVPGLTWVACASAVCHVGAVPILVDVDPDTLCLSAESVRKAVTPFTRAILMVHLYSSLALVDEIQNVATQFGIPIIEDASQAHGAKYKGRRTGTFGIITVFSMQQSKLLTAGEGGACVTNDEVLYRRMQQFRADGRVYAGIDGYDPYREIVPLGETLGRNLCLSEFHAAILLDALSHLDDENCHRRQMFAKLNEMIKSIDGVKLISNTTAEEPTYYRVCLQFDDTWLKNLSISTLARALTEELSLSVEPIDTPLNANPLYNPLRSPQIGRLAGARELYDPSQFCLPFSAEASRRCLTIPHWALLGDDNDIKDVIAAILKLKDYIKDLSCIDLKHLRTIPFRSNKDCQSTCEPKL